MCTEMSHSNSLESAPLNGYVSTSTRAVSVGPSLFWAASPARHAQKCGDVFLFPFLFSNTTVKIQYLNASGSLN